MAVPLTLSSVPAQTPYVQYVSGSSQTVFPYPFEITQDSDLVCLINGVQQATDSGYTLSGQGTTVGGNLTFTVGQTAGTIITLYRNISISRITQLSQNGTFFSSNFNNEYNRIYLIMQQLQQSLLPGGNQAFALMVPNSNSPPATTLLTPAVYKNSYLSFDSNGNPQPAMLTSSGAITASIVGGLLNPTIAPETAASVTPSTFTIATDPTWNPKRYGALNSNTDAQNISALNKALAVSAALTGTLNGSFITIPADIHYGYQVYNPSTFPQFGATQPSVVLDVSAGESYAGFPTAYDGAQARWFFNTPQTTSPGQHDGNGMRIIGNWAPYLWIDNDSQTANPSVNSYDNRRANLFFGNDGNGVWGVGQGSQSGSGLYQGTLSNFQIQKFGGTPGSGLGGSASQAITFTGTLSMSATSATLASNWLAGNGAYPVTFSNGDVRAVTFVNGATTATWTTGLTSNATASAVVAASTLAVWICDYLTGNQNFGTGSNNANVANYWFKSPVAGYVVALFEGLTDPVYLGLRDPSGSSNDVFIKNESGALALNISSQGDALVIAKANRAATFSTGLSCYNASPPAQLTGWGTPVGNAVISNYNITDAGGSNSNTNKAVASIIATLKAFGLYAA